jgi:hypothetical protein
LGIGMGGSPARWPVGRLRGSLASGEGGEVNLQGCLAEAKITDEKPISNSDLISTLTVGWGAES